MIISFSSSGNQDTQYFSDSEHHYVGNSYIQRQELRRLRNRTLSGLDQLRAGMANSDVASAAAGLTSRPSSAMEHRAITPSMGNDKESGQNFIDFNPAGKSIFGTLGW